MNDVKENEIYNNLCLEKDNLPKFFLIFGNLIKNKEIVKNFFKIEKKIDIKENKNFLEFDYDLFKIDDARKIKIIQSSKKNNDIQIILITVRDINIYTQNMLLKTLEEPARNTFIFIFLENDFKILPTLKSRARILNNFTIQFSENFLLFLKSDFSKREEIIKKMENNRDKISFVSEFELYFLENKNLILDNNNTVSYKNLLYFKKIAQTEGVNISNILNFLAIKIPKI